MSVIQECMQDNDNILQVENICKYYKAGSGRLFDKTVFKAVNQVSFSVKRGETFWWENPAAEKALWRSWS
jgi:ABC-type glutathione transport system ATPase component